MPLPPPPPSSVSVQSSECPRPHRVISMEGMEGRHTMGNKSKVMVPSGVSLTQALAAKGFKTGGGGEGGRTSRSSSIVSDSRDSVSIDYCVPRPQDKLSYLESMGFQTYDSPKGTDSLCKIPDWYDQPHTWTDSSSLLSEGSAQYLPNGYLHMQSLSESNSPRHSSGNWATPPESNYDYPPPPRLAHPNNIYDIPPPPRLANPSNDDTYDVPPPPRPLVDDTYDVPPPPRPLINDTYDVPPPPRPLINDTYDVPPPPRPLINDTYDVPPPPRPLINDTYDVPPPPRPLINDVPLSPRPYDVPLSPRPYDVPLSPRPYDVPPPPCLANPPIGEDTYDYPPPPRPAFSNYERLSPIEAVDFQKPDERKIESPRPPSSCSKEEEKNKHHYVNLATIAAVLDGESPPAIDRKNKPAPKIDRSTKPKSSGASVSPPLVPNSDHTSRHYSSSSSSTVSDLSKEEPFSPTRDVPRLTRNSVRYCHVTFPKKKPMPSPRTKVYGGSSPIPTTKYQYSDVDLLATANFKETTSSNSSYCSDSGISSSDPANREDLGKNEIFDNFSGSFEESVQVRKDDFI